jgi:hypothetical protein
LSNATQTVWRDFSTQTCCRRRTKHGLGAGGTRGLAQVQEQPRSRHAAVLTGGMRLPRCTA